LLPFRYTGPEVAFERRVPAGQAIRVTGVLKRWKFLAQQRDLVVLAPSLGLPARMPVYLPLYGENAGRDGGPSARVYRRVHSDSAQ
jgi:hypothetical protein